MFNYLKILYFLMYYSDKKHVINKMIPYNVIPYNKVLTNKVLNCTEGIDERFLFENNKEENEYFLLHNLKVNHNKKKILEFLENEKISIVKKLNVIEEYKKENNNRAKYMSNFFAGGLMDEYSKG